MFNTTAASPIQLWYRHDMGSSKMFFKGVANEESAKKQMDVAFDLMRFLSGTSQIPDYRNHNAAGSDVFNPHGTDKVTVTHSGRNKPNVIHDDNKAVAPKEGDLRIWYIHQVGVGEVYNACVDNADDAVTLLSTIYDLMMFLHNNHQITDYTNAGGVEVYESDGDGGLEWCEWYNDDGDDADTIISNSDDD